MRIVLGILACSFVVGMAGPAAAHTRDPFDPLVTEDTSGGTVAGDTFEEPAPPAPAPDNERLAETGAPIREWVGLALALMGLGAAIVLASTTSRPAAIRHRRGSVA